MDVSQPCPTGWFVNGDACDAPTRGPGQYHGPCEPHVAFTAADPASAKREFAVSGYLSCSSAGSLYFVLDQGLCGVEFCAPDLDESSPPAVQPLDVAPCPKGVGLVITQRDAQCLTGHAQGWMTVGSLKRVV